MRVNLEAVSIATRIAEEMVIGAFMSLTLPEHVIINALNDLVTIRATITDEYGSRIFAIGHIADNGRVKIYGKDESGSELLLISTSIDNIGPIRDQIAFYAREYRNVAPRRDIGPGRIEKEEIIGALSSSRRVIDKAAMAIDKIFIPNTEILLDGPSGLLYTASDGFYILLNGVTAQWTVDADIDIYRYDEVMIWNLRKTAIIDDEVGHMALTFTGKSAFISDIELRMSSPETDIIMRMDFGVGEDSWSLFERRIGHILMIEELAFEQIAHDILSYISPDADKEKEA